MRGPDIYDDVAAYYRQAAKDGRDRTVDAIGDDRWGTHLYDAESLDALPAGAAELSMGCGNPYLLADLRDGDVVLDLGSGGGIDVILSARRVAPSGIAYGLDMLPEMVEIGTRNAAEAGVNNARFLEGMMESIPLPDDSVDVVISNCVISLAPDKAPAFSEAARVLRPGGRLAISDVVADDGSDLPFDRAAWVDCGSGALEFTEYRNMLTTAGFESVTIDTTHEVGSRLKAAMIRAIRCDRPIP